ncbi:MAG: hypothetical protein F4Z78_07745, partial [Gammaproteobacteria bacterium]|nr:hypothetical protein [Gammaproteobacteria bacterium]
MMVSLFRRIFARLRTLPRMTVEEHADEITPPRGSRPRHANRRNADMSNAQRTGWVPFLILVASAGWFGGTLRAQTSTHNPYRATLGWEQLPDGRTLGIVSGAIPDPDGEHLWILDRCGANQCAGTDIDPILKFDLDGNLVESFGAGLFAFPHGFALDHEGYLWVTEGGAHGD